MDNGRSTMLPTLQSAGSSTYQSSIGSPDGSRNTDYSDGGASQLVRSHSFGDDTAAAAAKRHDVEARLDAYQAIPVVSTLLFGMAVQVVVTLDEDRIRGYICEDDTGEACCACPLASQI